MKDKYRLFFFTFLILTVISAKPLWPKNSPSFQKDLAAFHKNSNDLDLREKVIQDVLSLKLAPALPKVAAKLKAEAKEAFEKSQFKVAAQTLEKASDLAPWDAGIYSDLAQSQEKAELYPEAIQSLNLYLLAAPAADDRQQVQDRIKKLDDENKHWMADQIDHLDDDDVENSLARRLVEMGPAAKTEVLFLAKALKNNDMDTRSHAAMILGQLGNDAVPAIADLSDRLDDPQTLVRENAAFALSKVGPAAVQVLPDLIDTLRDDDENVRTSVAFALGNIGPAAAKAVPALTKALRDTNSKVRANSAFALGKIGPDAKEALPALAALANDSDPMAKKNGAWAVQQINAKAE
jgi:HEAT repeat protein